MKIKKSVPMLITAGISLIMLVIAFLSSKVNITSFPFMLYEKLGLYYEPNYSIVANDTLSANGTLEGFVSLLKLASFNTTIPSLLSGLIYSALILVSLLMLSKSAMVTQYKWTGYLAVVMLPVMFFDFSNVVYFKTLYNQPIILTLLLLIFAVFVRTYQKEKASITLIVLLFVLTALYSFTGVVQAITALILGVLIIRLSAISTNKASKIVALLLGIFVIIESLVFSFNYKPYDYKQQIYNSVFFGVCKYDSVKELGLDEKLDDFKGVYFGMMENEDEKYDLENTFYSKISYSKILKYYITHPVNAIKIIGHQASLAFYNDNDFGFTPYSTAKKLYVPAKLLTTLVFAVVSAIICLAVRKGKEKFKYFAEFYIGLGVMLVASLVASAIYHGNCDVNFNMYTFSVIFDIMFISGLVTGIRLIIMGQDEKKEKFGITHE